MKLPSHLAKNRHGVFYFRLSFFIGLSRKEKRWSLRTKNSGEAKQISLQLCALLRENYSKLNQSLCENDQVVTNWFENELTSRVGDYVKKDNCFDLTTVFHKNGNISVKTDPSDPKDVALGEEMTKKLLFAKSKPESSSYQDFWPVDVDAFNTLKPNSGVTHSNSPEDSIESLIGRYKKRNQARLKPLTCSEYEKNQKKFADWLTSQGKFDGNHLHLLSRKEVSGFIEYLQQDGIALQTIQKKYLAALNGLFEFAQSAGAYPSGELPTKGHKIFTRRDKKKAQLENGWEPFSDEELSLIFAPENLLVLPKPCDFWLPLLGLFTGGRISELCQLKPSDISQRDGVWAIDINADDEDQSIKTAAGIRIIPLHSQLIALGFLDYLEDVKKYNGTIFPYLIADKYMRFTKTPSRRFGEYMTKLGIVEKRKVFHSFRSTANNCLKQLGVPEESRCQFVGHEHNTVNSKSYSKRHDVRFMQENIASKLVFPSVDFTVLKYQREKMREELEHLMKLKLKKQGHKEAKAIRDQFL
jgi:integrase